MKNNSSTSFPSSSLKSWGRTTPHALDVEVSILGAILLEKESLNQVVDLLRPSHFYKPAHQYIYTAILDLFNNHEVIDIHTITIRLKKNNNLEAVGGIAYLSSLTENIASAIHLNTHIQIVLEYAIRRDLISIGSQIQKEGYNEELDIIERLDILEQKFLKIGSGNIQKNYESIDYLMQVALQKLDDQKSNEGGVTGISSGFTDLDRVLLGWQPSDLVIVAARPGMGKTSFLLSLLRHAAVRSKQAVALFSLEMSSLQLTNRLISQETKLENEKIKRSSLKNYEWEQLYHKTSDLVQAPIFIDDTPNITLFQLSAKCRRLKAKHNIKIFIIDYIQLMSGDPKKQRSGGTREQEISSISRGLKSIAKENDVTIIVASQLSRAVEMRGGDKRPQLSDLRESGAIEQDADLVLFLYRPAYYGITEDLDGCPTDKLTELIIAKHRNGATGKVKLFFDSSTTNFSNWGNSGGAIPSKANNPV